MSKAQNVTLQFAVVAKILKLGLICSIRRVLREIRTKLFHLYRAKGSRDSEGITT
jgi:hypothetical protein